jgi:hypothetical protein
MNLLSNAAVTQECHQPGRASTLTNATGQPAGTFEEEIQAGHRLPRPANA